MKKTTFCCLFFYLCIYIPYACIKLFLCLYCIDKAPNFSQRESKKY